MQEETLMTESKIKQKVKILYNIHPWLSFFGFSQQVRSSFPVTLISDQGRVLKYVGNVIAGMIKTHHVSSRVH